MLAARLVALPAAQRGVPAAGNTRQLPAALRRHIVPQRHDDYGPAAHATWCQLRERTAQLVHELKLWLHPDYIEGFRRLILPWSRIPTVAEVSEALAEFGWSAVCVDGYLPTKVYAGLLARRVFPVARHIRRPEHLEFSPVPDLAHDLVGHVPMLVSREHGQFLRRLATALWRAPHSPLEQLLYRANRECSALRCRRRPPPELQLAEARVARIQRRLGRHPSALTELGRLYLWSIEFGLLGSVSQFRIYGAGLLSSPEETRAVCRKHAPIRELSLAAAQHEFRFSELQSAYFVANDYSQLHGVLSGIEQRWALGGSQ
jgi:phenylalanine-4-hydroxylase